MGDSLGPANLGSSQSLSLTVLGVEKNPSGGCTGARQWQCLSRPGQVAEGEVRGIVVSPLDRIGFLGTSKGFFRPLGP